jgi:hypothetical protein
MRARETFPPVTLSHIRGHRCRYLLVYCNALDCNHSAVLNADTLPSDAPIRPLGQRMRCTHCGHRGAEVRPDWRPHTNKPRSVSQPSGSNAPPPRGGLPG